MLNFGWPCYEGPVPEGGFQPLNTPRCTALYSTPAAMTQAYYQYRHGVAVVPGENCNASSDQSRVTAASARINAAIAASEADWFQTATASSTNARVIPRAPTSQSVFPAESP